MDGDMLRVLYHQGQFDVGDILNPLEDPKCWQIFNFMRVDEEFMRRKNVYNDQDLAGFRPVSQKRGSEPEKHMETENSARFLHGTSYGWCRGNSIGS